MWSCLTCAGSQYRLGHGSVLHACCHVGAGPLLLVLHSAVFRAIQPCGDVQWMARYCLPPPHGASHADHEYTPSGVSSGAGLAVGDAVAVTLLVSELVSLDDGVADAVRVGVRVSVRVSVGVWVWELLTAADTDVVTV